jgi:hypothetical protein
VTTRVYATLEIEGGRVVLRDETGAELAVVHERGRTPAEAFASDLVTDLVHNMRSMETDPNDE